MKFIGYTLLFFLISSFHTQNDEVQIVIDGNLNCFTSKKTYKAKVIVPKKLQEKNISLAGTNVSLKKIDGNNNEFQLTFGHGDACISVIVYDVKTKKSNVLKKFIFKIC